MAISGDAICDAPDWVPAAVPNLYVTNRGDSWLCLNPDVPGWIVTNRAGVLLLRLADGVRSLAEITALLSTRSPCIHPSKVEQFFHEASEAGLFSCPRQDDPVYMWKSRRLSTIHLHLTNRCNLECAYCLRDSGPLNPIRHRPETFIDLLRYIKTFTAEVFTITYTGGEPLMYPGFEKVVMEASNLGYRNGLLTNGMLLNETRAEFIARHFTWVRVSLDGPDPVTHAKGRGNNFNKVLRGIHLLSDRMEDVTVQATVGTWNLDRVDGLRDLLPERVRIAYTPVLPFGRGRRESKVYITDQQFLSLSRRPAAAQERVESRSRPGQQIRGCSAGLANLSIADTGDVYPCHVFHEQQFHLGNIFHDSFEKIFYGDRTREYVISMDVEHNNSTCRGCEVRYICGGGCKGNTLHETGDHRGVDPYCGFNKGAIIDNLFASAGVATLPR